MNSILKVKILEISKTKEIFFVAVFTLFAVYTPAIIHFFGGSSAGQKFLPMPFFVLLAGIILGWRAGLATAVAAPIVSFLISGMPAMEILPFIMFQLAVLGIISGMLRNKKNIFIVLAGSMAFSWVTIGIALFIFSKINTMNYVFSGIKSGLFGIILELALIPIILVIINKYLFREKEI